MRNTELDVSSPFWAVDSGYVTGKLILKLRLKLKVGNINKKSINC